MEDVQARAGAHLQRRVSGANTAGFGWEDEPVRWAGLRIMSEGNYERTTTCFASRGSSVRLRLSPQKKKPLKISNLTLILRGFSMFLGHFSGSKKCKKCKY